MWSTKIVSHKLNFCVAFFHTSTTMFAVLFTMFIYYQPHFIPLFPSFFFLAKKYLYFMSSDWMRGRKMFWHFYRWCVYERREMYTGKWEDKRSYWKVQHGKINFLLVAFDGFVGSTWHLLCLLLWTNIQIFELNSMGSFIDDVYWKIWVLNLFFQ